MSHFLAPNYCGGFFPNGMVSYVFYFLRDSTQTKIFFEPTIRVTNRFQGQTGENAAPLDYLFRRGITPLFASSGLMVLRCLITPEKRICCLMPSRTDLGIPLHPTNVSISPRSYKDQCFDLPSIIQMVDRLEELSMPFTNSEIGEVVKNMPADRAPGPDGFSRHFIKSCWHIIKHDFY